MIRKSRIIAVNPENKGKAIEPNKEGAAQNFEKKHKVQFNDFNKEVQDNLKLSNGDIGMAINRTLSDRGLSYDYSEINEVTSDYTRAFLESDLPSKLPGKRGLLNSESIDGEVRVKAY